MTKSDVRDYLKIDRVMAYLGLATLLISIGVTWQDTKGDIEAQGASIDLNTKGIASVRLAFVAADSAIKAESATRFERVNEQNKDLYEDMVEQRVLTQQVLTTVELTREAVKDLTSQIGN